MAVCAVVVGDDAEDKEGLYAVSDSEVVCIDGGRGVLLWVGSLVCLGLDEE